MTETGPGGRRERTPFKFVDAPAAPAGVAVPRGRRTHLALGSEPPPEAAAAEQEAKAVYAPIYGFPTIDKIGAWERRESELLAPLVRHGEPTGAGADARVLEVDEADLLDRLGALKAQVTHYRSVPAGKAALERIGPTLGALLDAGDRAGARSQLRSLVHKRRIIEFAKRVIYQYVHKDKHVDPKEHESIWVMALEWDLGEADIRAAIKHLEAEFQEEISVDPREGLAIYFGDRREPYPTIDALREAIDHDERTGFRTTREAMENRKLSNRFEDLSRDVTVPDIERKNLGELCQRVREIERRYQASLAPVQLLYALGHRKLQVGTASFESLSELVESSVEPAALAPFVASKRLALWLEEALDEQWVVPRLTASDGRTDEQKAARFLFAAGRRRFAIAGVGTFESVEQLAQLACRSRSAWAALVSALGDVETVDYVTEASAGFRRHVQDAVGRAIPPAEMAQVVAKVAGVRSCPIFVDAESEAKPYSSDLAAELLLAGNFDPLAHALVGGGAQVFFGAPDDEAPQPPTPARQAVRFAALAGESRVFVPRDLDAVGVVLGADTGFVPFGIQHPDRLWKYVASGQLYEWARVFSPDFADVLEPNGDGALQLHHAMWALGFEGFVTGSLRDDPQVHEDPQALVSVARGEVLHLVENGVLGAWLAYFKPDSHDAILAASVASTIRVTPGWYADRALEVLGAAAPEAQVSGTTAVAVEPGGSARVRVFVSNPPDSQSALRFTVDFSCLPEEISPYSVAAAVPYPDAGATYVELLPGQTCEIPIAVELPHRASGDPRTLGVAIRDVDRPGRVWTVDTTLSRKLSALGVFVDLMTGVVAGVVLFLFLSAFDPDGYGLPALLSLASLVFVVRFGSLKEKLKAQGQTLGGLGCGLLVAAAFAIPVIRAVLEHWILPTPYALAHKIAGGGSSVGWAVVGGLTGFVAGSSRAAARYLNGAVGVLFAVASVVLATFVLWLAA